MRSIHLIFGMAVLATGAIALPRAALQAASNGSDAAAEAAVADGGRPYWDVARDANRKPAQILQFAQIKPGMVVVDLIPGDGYYTRMLSALVGPKGKVYAVVEGGDPRGLRLAQRQGLPPSMIPKDKGDACALGCYDTSTTGYMLPVDQVLALENITEYKNVTVLEEGLNGGELALPEQADVILSVDGYHQLHFKDLPKLPTSIVGRGGNPRALDVAALDKGAFATLKNGGVFVVADYAAPQGSKFDNADKLHRTEADATKAEVLGAGFVLDGESNALANSNDDHAKLADGAAADRDKADQYVFRFKKPSNAPNTDKRPTPQQEAAIMKNYYGNTFIGGVDETSLDSSGQRIRTSFYNSDHTYQEFGRINEGPGPMQSGVWFWDAEGKNCELHQYPIDERANVVCHGDVIPHQIGVVEAQNPDGKGKKVEIVKGHVFSGWIVP